MEYVIGVDGGGTKTAVALADRDGNLLAQTVLESISYREHGMEAVARRLRAGTERVLAQAGLPAEAVRAAAVGAPGFGENPGGDRALEETVAAAFPGIPAAVVNDAQIAFYGALGGAPGINLVAGTGAIAYGEDGRGGAARSGGWSEQFSDEGSCYWLGRMAMGLFCKEADGREPEGALYRLLREELGLKDDLDFITVMERDYLPDRGRTAGLQALLLQAARAGDGAVIALYRRACGELAQLAGGVRGRLQFAGAAPVSLTGGLLHAGGLVAGPLAELLAAEGMVYQPCKGAPLDGAVYLARRTLAG